MEEPEVRRKPKWFRDRSGGDLVEEEGERNPPRKHRGKKIWSTMTKGWRPGSRRRSKGEETGLLVQEEEEEEPDAGKKEKSKDPKKQKKKRKGWKRVRHALLITCRYIGMGVAHMAPTSTYPSDYYYVDPYSWYIPHGKEFNCPKAQPHWTTGLVLNGW